MSIQNVVAGMPLPPYTQTTSNYGHYRNSQPQVPLTEPKPAFAFPQVPSTLPKLATQPSLPTTVSNPVVPREYPNYRNFRNTFERSDPEASRVAERFREFINEYIIETEAQKLEIFDKLDLSVQKDLLKGQNGEFGYENSGTLQGVSKLTSRLLGMRKNNNSRKEDNFIKARRKYVFRQKMNELMFNFGFGLYLRPAGPKENGRIYFLSYLNKLPETKARNKAIEDLSESGKFKPDEKLVFHKDALDLFSGSVKQSAGKRRNRTKKVRRNKGKKTRRN